jgi:hypothetical protein
MLCGKSLIVCLSPVWPAMFMNESNSSAVVFLVLGCRRRNVTGENWRLCQHQQLQSGLIPASLS